VKNNHICTKCGSNDILLIHGKAGVNGENCIQMGWNAVPVHRYVCCTCGYSEEWIDGTYIGILKEKYGK
jgi:hypothetical protein